MNTVRLTMAQALVRFLENQYIAYDGKEHPFVEGVIMLPGHGNVVGLGQALAQETHHLKVWQGKNEQDMAHTAVAFARQMKRKKIIAVTSSVGPGAANMVTAAATATANNIPVLILPGDVYACRQPDPVLQQVEQIMPMLHNFMLPKVLQTLYPTVEHLIHMIKPMIFQWIIKT